MRKQYHFRPSKNGYYAWDVDKLVTRSKDFPVISVKLSEIKELDENFWYGGDKAILNKDQSIKAVKFDKTSEPDYEDVFPDELSYDEDCSK